MSARPFLGIAASLLGFCALAWPASAQQVSIEPQMWSSYKAKFLDASGRIVDDGNGNISHSEGQGYGLLLAYLANNPADFEQIWYFTHTELLLRDDGLAAWKWMPESDPHVTDINNASDGDILIAYALAKAGMAWTRSDYTAAATRIAAAVLSKLIVEENGRTLLLPGGAGFDASDREDGPVINLSYWVFEAFPVLAALVPSDKWQKLSDDGKALIQQVQFGPKKLPADWVSLKTRPRPAQGFATEYGYNSLRIPLYMLRAGQTDLETLRRLTGGAADPNGHAAIMDLASGAVKTALSDPGYELVNHIVACVESGKKLPVEVRQFVPTLYYPSTLQLLGLSFVAEKHPECL